jgi:hypothetical protein
VTSATAAAGFAIAVPESWFELDVRPATRDNAIRMLVQQRIQEQGELWEHRNELVKVLRRAARDAWESGAVYCACFAIVVENALIPGSLTVSVIPPPPSGAALESLVDSLVLKEPAADGEPFSLRSVVELEGVGAVARSRGIADVELPGGAGRIRSLVMQTFVPVDADRIVLIGASSPALDLIEPLFELFDAVTSTFRLVG